MCNFVTQHKLPQLKGGKVAENVPPLRARLLIPTQVPKLGLLKLEKLRLFLLPPGAEDTDLADTWHSRRQIETILYPFVKKYKDIGDMDTFVSPPKFRNYFLGFFLGNHLLILGDPRIGFLTPRISRQEVEWLRQAVVGIPGRPSAWRFARLLIANWVA